MIDAGETMCHHLGQIFQSLARRKLLGKAFRQVFRMTPSKSNGYVNVYLHQNFKCYEEKLSVQTFHRNKRMTSANHELVLIRLPSIFGLFVV